VHLGSRQAQKYILQFSSKTSCAFGTPPSMKIGPFQRDVTINTGLRLFSERRVDQT
jgi:hypothetical protein